jgi:dihydrolipoamide dehydrogenase
MEDLPTKTDLLVIGGGPGGYVAAIRAGQLGLDVTLVEADAVGGTCLNYGCIPSKALITATDRVDDIAHSEEMGIYAEPYLDVSEMVDWKDEVVENLTGGVASLCRSNGVTIVEARAELTAENEAIITVSDGDTGTISFDDCILATGSRPVELPNFSFEKEPVWDSQEALAIDEVPGQLLVVGAGYIGMELSTVFAKLGCDVTVVEMLDEVMPTFPTDLVAPVHERAQKHGVDFHFGLAASHWEKTGDGVTVVAKDEDDDTASFDCDAVVVAVGRQPVIDTAGLDAVSIELTDDGFVDTDDRWQTSVDSIYAVGDVAGDPLLAHAASREGVVVAETIAGERGDHGTEIPAVVFTDPEIATIGLTEEEAVNAGYEPLVGRFPFSASGRAMTGDDTAGFVKLVADDDTGQVLGGHIVGPEASELVGTLTVAVEREMSVDELAGVVFPHPTLLEAIGESADHALGHALHTSN